MIIHARPEFGCTIYRLNSNDDTEIESVFCLRSDLENKIFNYIENTNYTIDNVCLVGPNKYIENIILTIQEKYPNINIFF